MNVNYLPYDPYSSTQGDVGRPYTDSEYHTCWRCGPCRWKNCTLVISCEAVAPHLEFTHGVKGNRGPIACAWHDCGEMILPINIAHHVRQKHFLHQ
ncbi:hypothetical protein SCLCIDRAFT_1220017 [Scleroderma citrinum Foug A]|uniref:Uncharacterized protein n=1 Tax=Scleroderma citrinum Foug A TaxID=1036808 RepID=A0A0C3DKA8_9AGAM|nr:hypothetical protein SCLCIDRAFT_1220017 [Scleroderma citrinum Foug A]